jgi:hypothetical protein
MPAVLSLSIRPAAVDAPRESLVKLGSSVSSSIAIASAKIERYDFFPVKKAQQS